MRSYKKRRVGKKNKKQKTKRRQRKVKKISGGYNPKAQLHLEDLIDINEEIDKLPIIKSLGKDFKQLLKHRIKELLEFEVKYINYNDPTDLSNANELKLDISAMLDNYKIDAENAVNYINIDVKNAVDDIYLGMDIARENLYN